ncbi:hypothetical protein [Mesorhizobium argentiipisi]|uniref:DUF403 domain-containing protein n=1 Tax=Mesorhizobium argentiipisi TaxID=3015175 RepID=A0ABU8K982_9HYPH
MISFGNDAPAWVALSHFLSAGLVRELCAATIDATSDGTIQLGDLCIEQISVAPPHLATWTIRLKTGQEGLATYLQNVLRVLTWQSDARLHYDDNPIPEAFRERCRTIASALELATVDFSSISYWLASTEGGSASLNVIGKSIGVVAAIGDGADPATIRMADEALASLAPPLRIVATKHLGDLALEADRPSLAGALYETTQRLCEGLSDRTWSEIVEPVADMTLQSLATVSGMAGSLKTTYAMLGAVQAPEILVSRPLIALNAALAAMHAGYQSADGLFFQDVRACVLDTPLLQYSHNLGAPLDHWAKKKFTDAHRCFWAALRRLNALGGATLSTEAMGLYGRSLFDELYEQIGRHRQQDRFDLALRLVISSGRDDAVGPEASREDLVDAYVTQEVIGLATEVAERHSGVRRERLNVLVKLFVAWLGTLSAEKDQLARLLIDAIAKLAQESPGDSLIQGHSLPKTSLVAIKEIARKRPEFVHSASRIIADAILAGFAAQRFDLIVAGLEAAVGCAVAFAPDDLARLADATLTILENRLPSESAWPIVSPAITFIACDEVQALWAENSEFGSRCAQTILRHGLGGATEGTRLLALLDEILPHLDAPVAQDERIQEVVRTVRDGALKSNHSGVTGNISVLFATPALAGRDGIDDAVRGLIALLGTATTQRHNIAIASAYQPLNTLTYRLDVIAEALSLSPSDLDALLDPIVSALEQFWRAARHNSLLFAPFAIPLPTAPNLITVQNWAFVTLGFARRAGVFDRLRKVVEEAADNDQLARPIALAQAVRMTAGDPISLDPDAICLERREPFYAALGERLTYIAAIPTSEHTTRAVSALVERCLALGPNGLDAGVFVIALRQEAIELPTAAFKSYQQRLERNRALMQGLFPLFRSLTKQSV